MKKQLALLAACLMAPLAWGQNFVVKVDGGLIQGVSSAAGDVTVFRGIPYEEIREDLRNTPSWIRNLILGFYDTSRRQS